MRVLQILPTLDRGGAEKQMCLLAAGLPRDQFEVEVCALTRGGPLERDLEAAAIPLHQIHKRWKFDPGAYRRLKALIRSRQPDLVHTWIFAANAYGRQAAAACGVPHLVAGERCVDHWKSWELWVDRRLAKRTSRIATNSSGVRDFYVGKGIAAEKFAIIPNGVTVGPQHNPDERSRIRLEVRAELMIDPSHHVVIAVGRLWPQKRYKDLIWAADLLKVIRDDVHLIIAGDGPQRWRLERFRDQVRIRDRVHFLGHRDDVPRLLAASDVFWIGSGYEGQSNALLEAMAAELPVVASDIPGNRDLVAPLETGQFVPVGDRAGFARLTNALLDDPDLAARQGAAGRRRVEVEFSVDKMIQRHVALYREIAAGPPGAQSR